MVNIQECLSQMKETYEMILKFIDTEKDLEENYQNLIKILNDQKIDKDINILRSTLHILINLANNHYRVPDFYSRIEKILKYLENNIKKNLTNYDIFNIFGSNKRILLFFIEEQIFSIDQQIAYLILNQKKYIEAKYHQYFAPEIKPFIDDLLKIDHRIKLKRNTEKNYFEEFESAKLKRQLLEELPEDFEANRKNGVNEAETLKLIQKDSISDFISHVNRENIKLDVKINPSIYETSPFLTCNVPTLIEYAAFYGSTQIFNYLYKNGVTLTSSIWIYAIHGNNPEIIHLLEEEKIFPSEKENDKNEISYKDCYIESIKCHHNDIKDYILNNYFKENDVSQYLKYHNFNICFDDVNLNNYLYELCSYDHFTIFKLIIENNSIDINQIVVHVNGKEITDGKTINNPYSKGFRKSFESFLSIACRKGNIEMVKYLLSFKEIDINHLSVYKGYKKNCNFLKLSDKEKFVDFSLRSMLFDSEHRRRMDPYIIEEITNWCDESTIEKETYEKTALYVAIEKRNIDIVRLLLSNHKLDINIINNEYTYFWGNRAILKERYQKNALFKAVEKENVEIVKLLLDKFDLDINFTEKYSNLFYMQSYDIKYEEENYFKWENFLTEEKDKEIDQNMKKSLLYEAVEKENIEIIKLLLENDKIDVNDYGMCVGNPDFSETSEI